MNSKLGIHFEESGTNDDFWDTMRRKAHGYPEQDLLLAVLKDALVNYRKNLRRRNKTAHADRAWFFDREADRLFSFESVCAALGLSAERIRQHLLAWERGNLSVYKPNMFADADRPAEQLLG